MRRGCFVCALPGSGASSFKAVFLASRVFGVCILGATRSSFVCIMGASWVRHGCVMGASWVRLDTTELA